LFGVWVEMVGAGAEAGGVGSLLVAGRVVGKLLLEKRCGQAKTYDY
jgi:hypothetical protein